MSPEPVMVELGFQSRPNSALPPNEVESRDALSYTASSPLGLGHHLHRTCSLNMDIDNWDEDNGKVECTCGQRRAERGSRGLSGLEASLEEDRPLRTRGSAEEGLEFHRKRELRPVLPLYGGGGCGLGLLTWESKGGRQERLMKSHLEELPEP
uniref:Uncharacterized protein n=1 Tax=Mandrillus leucophaeus TaxID=9568 RepID=A0A2K5ZAH6_MANLE